MAAPVAYLPYDIKDFEIYQNSLNQRDEEIQERWEDLTGNLSERNAKLLTSLQNMNSAYKDLNADFQAFKVKAYTGIALSCCAVVGLSVLSLAYMCK